MKFLSYLKRYKWAYSLILLGIIVLVFSFGVVGVRTFRREVEVERIVDSSRPSRPSRPRTNLLDRWTQVNQNGFGRSDCSSTTSMVFFNGYLYAATENKGRLFRTNGTTESESRNIWQEVYIPHCREYRPERRRRRVLIPPHIHIGSHSWEVLEIRSVDNLTVFETTEGPWLYLSIVCTLTRGTTIYENSIILRSRDETSWEQTGTLPYTVTDAGRQTVTCMEIFNGYLYVAYGDTIQRRPDEFCIWRTDGSSWEECTQELPFGPGDCGFDSMKAFNGYLYAGTYGLNESGTGADRTAEIWRTDGVAINEDGEVFWEKAAELYSETMAEIECMEVFKGNLYAGTKNHPVVSSDACGPELYRTIDGDGERWEEAFTDAQINPARLHFDSLLAYNGVLYAGVGGGGSGPPVGQVCKSLDGVRWRDITPVELTENTDNYLVPASTIAWGSIFFGTGFTVDNGTEIWRYSFMPTARAQSLVPSGTSD